MATLLLAALSGAAGALALDTDNTTHDIQAKQAAGRFIAGFLLEDGGEIVVTIRTPPGKQYLDFVYFPTDADWFNMSEVQLTASEPPDAMDAWACGCYIHVFLGWDSDEAAYAYRWRIPVEINQAFLPVVCKGGH